MPSRARQPVAARRRSDIKDRIAHAAGFAPHNLVVPEDAQAKGVDDGIAFVRFVEIDLARDGRDAETISVMRDPADHVGE